MMSGGFKMDQNVRSDFITTEGAARRYLALGWRVIPVPAGRKGPAQPGWRGLNLTEADLPRFFGDGRPANVGVVLGHRSGDLVDIDLDSPETLALADHFLPPTRAVFGRPSAPGSHRLYVAPGAAYRKFQDPDGATLLELRTDGEDGGAHQTLFPPSIHPSGERYAWQVFEAPAEIDPAALENAVRRLAAAALLARYWPKPGSRIRHETALALAGALVRAGWAEEEAANFVEAVAEAAGDEETRDRMRAARDTARRHELGARTTGLPRLRELLAPEVVDRAAEWLGLSRPRPPVTARSPVLLAEATFPEPPDDAAYYGLAGDFVRAVEPHSEADPVALLGQFLAAFGSVVGRGPYFRVEGDRHHTNLFLTLVGETAKGRKGSAWGHVLDFWVRVDPSWGERVMSGLSSGEGLIWQVRDPICKMERREDKEKRVYYEQVTVDDGVADKRLLVFQGEFGGVLKVLSREGNTLSAVIRDAWDRGDLRTLVKNSPARATGAHISIIAHITREEVRRHLRETELANGFANRFIWLAVRRSKCLPEGGSLDPASLNHLVERGRKAVEFARTVGEMRRDDAARRDWSEVYSELSEGRPGLMGAVLARAEAQVLRLSMLYALLDCSAVIRQAHLEAALALWEYAERSALWIFGDRTGDEVADRILTALRGAGEEGLVRTDIHDLFGRNASEGRIAEALGILARLGLARVEKRSTGGRPAEVWFATG